jgi:tryptophan synthase alpha chain
MQRMTQRLQLDRAAGRGSLMPFVTAGSPSLEATVATIRTLDRLGVAAIEVGFPFSDPIADGPVIAASMDRALRSGTTVAATMEAIRSIRPQIVCGLIAMVSMSIVHRHGGAAFVRQAHDAGFDALIVPDMDVDAADQVLGAVDQLGMGLALLVAPTSTPERIRAITARCRGFVYALARAGLTGAGDAPPDVAATVAALRAETALPIAVGFGISTAEHVRMVIHHADAAIVGSALVRAVDGDPATAHERAGAFIQPMIDACRSARP